MALKFKRNSYLDKLAKLIETDFSSKSPSFAYLNPDGLARSWVLISVISTPYILWLLFKLRKFGWLISFVVFVLAPFLLNYMIIASPNARILVWAITLMNWVVFLFLLKSSYKNWREPAFKNTPGSDFR
tara:strand:+ start:220 stop:606 length:387 start_codon:yes stop_codon:yes gene_type:complete